MKNLMMVEKIERRIFQVRGKKVMLDSDLAALYQVKTKRLNEQVRRNRSRFPEDFMFQLTKEEADSLRSHFATTNRGGSRYHPYTFTQEGVAMLSSALNSERAILVNIQIMRAFVALRRVGLTYTGLKKKIEDMEKKYDKQFSAVFTVLKNLLESPEKPRRKIGFHADEY